MNNLFWFFTSDKAPVYFPGVSFLLGALFMLSSVIIAWKVLSRDRKHSLQTGAFDKPVQQ
jgi:DHA1 family tetracycline resistance protein-like MFS transporter